MMAALSRREAAPATRTSRATGSCTGSCRRPSVLRGRRGAYDELRARARPAEATPTESRARRRDLGQQQLRHGDTHGLLWRSDGGQRDSAEACELDVVVADDCHVVRDDIGSPEAVAESEGDEVVHAEDAVGPAGRRASQQLRGRCLASCYGALRAGDHFKASRRGARRRRPWLPGSVRRSGGGRECRSRRPGASDRWRAGAPPPAGRPGGGPRRRKAGQGLCALRAEHAVQTRPAQPGEVGSISVTGVITKPATRCRSKRST